MFQELIDQLLIKLFLTKLINKTKQKKENYYFITKIFTRSFSVVWTHRRRSAGEAIFFIGVNDDDSFIDGFSTRRWAKRSWAGINFFLNKNNKIKIEIFHIIY